MNKTDTRTTGVKTMLRKVTRGSESPRLTAHELKKYRNAVLTAPATTNHVHFLVRALNSYILALRSSGGTE